MKSFQGLRMFTNWKIQAKQVKEYMLIKLLKRYAGHSIDSLKTYAKLMKKAKKVESIHSFEVEQNTFKFWQK